MENWAGFDAELRQYREQRDMSLRALAKNVAYDPGALSRIENGLRKPAPDLVQALDDQLEAAGALLQAAAAAGIGEPDSVTSAAAQSMRFARWASADQVDQLSIDSLFYELARIATTCVHAPLQPLFADLEVLRTRWLPCNRLSQRDTWPNKPTTPGCRAWVAGTQALVAEWSGNPRQAIDFARRGTPFAPRGGDFTGSECYCEAVQVCESGAPERRSYGDESLARADIATARIAGHDPAGRSMLSDRSLCCRPTNISAKSATDCATSLES